MTRTPPMQQLREDVQVCHEQFRRLIDKRNALIHAHPITDRWRSDSQLSNRAGAFPT
jgi:hypothetical protein